MDDLFIKGTDTLPTVSFKTSGEMKISGRALPEDAARFFKPMMEWMKRFSAEEITIEVDLEYFNTSVSKQLFELFKAADKNPDIKTVRVKWMYEDGDDDMRDSGEIFNELLPGIRFSFHTYSELKD